MTDEEQFLLLQEEIERWLQSRGVDVDLDAMSQEELMAFWANPPVDMDDLEKFLDAVMTMETINRPETNWIWDRSFDDIMFGSEEADWGGFALDVALTLPGPLKLGKLGTWIGKAFPAGTKLPGWLGRVTGLTDEAATVTHTAGTTVRPGGFGRVEDIAKLGDEIRAGTRVGSIPGVLGRTGAGAGAKAPGPFSPIIPPGVARGATAAAGIAAGGAAVLGNLDPRSDFSLSDQYGHLQGSVTIGGVEIPSPFGPGDDREYEPEGVGEGFATEEEVAARKVAENVASIVDPEGTGILKQIFFQGLSEEAAFDKLTNYIADSSVNVLAAAGGSLGQALQNENVTLGDLQVVDLRGEHGKSIVRNYLQAHWQDVPEIAQSPWLGAAQGPGGFSGGPIPREEEVLEEVIEIYLNELSGRSATMLIAPEVAGGTGSPIGIITSFDGTNFGDIVSLNDMFSGGKIGEMNLLPLLNKARPEQIAMWQQQLYAWGYLEKSPAVWGQIAADPQTGDIPTLTAAHNWQIGVFNEGVQMIYNARARGDTRSLSELITPDGTPRADRVLDAAIARRMSGESTKATDERTLRDRVVAQAQGRVGEYLSATGRYLPEGAQLQIQSGLDEALSGLSSERQEAAFGQGGSQYERALAENILKEFYGSEDWGTKLTFGNMNNDSSFFDYAARVGAVSEREGNLLRDGVLQRGAYRDHWRERYDQLVEAEKDVAVAGLLKFVSETAGGDLSQATASDVAQGVTTYMHTIGMRQGLDTPRNQQELIDLANRAIAATRGMRFQQDDQMLTDVATGGVDQMGLRGGVSGYQFRGLVDELDRIGGTPSHLRVRNV